MDEGLSRKTKSAGLPQDEMSLEGDLQHALRIGDAVLFFAKEAHGYVFSELSR